MKRRGGVGHDHLISDLKVLLTKTLPLLQQGWFLLWSVTHPTREVAQDGRRRTYAFRSIKQPDSADFIDAKMEQGKITGANVSVRIDDDFMKAVESDGMYTQQYPVKLKPLNFERGKSKRTMV